MDETKYYCKKCDICFEGITELMEHAVFDHKQKGEETRIIVEVIKSFDCARCGHEPIDYCIYREKRTDDFCEGFYIPEVTK